MRVRVTLPTRDAKKLKDKLMPLANTVEEEDTTATEWELVALIDPGSFRVMNDIIAAESKGGAGRIETLSFAAVEGDQFID